MSDILKNSHQKGRQLLIPKSKTSNAASKAGLRGAFSDLDEVDSSLVYKSAAFEEKLAKLKEMMQTAIELEHSTIPPYLCALYSIKGETNKIASEIIKSVVLEEMLHMIMAANLLNAVGGRPQIGDGERNDDGTFMPSYPTNLPGNIDPALRVGLGCFSPESIHTFIQIEHPAREASEARDGSSGDVEFATIGEFYTALLAQIKELESSAQKAGETIFIGDESLQVTSEYYYGAGGKLYSVNDLASAEMVIEEIVGQGEGDLGSIFDDPTLDPDKDFRLFEPSVTEYAHYFRFKEVKYGRYYASTDSAHRDGINKGLPTGDKFEVNWEEVYPMQPNPKMSDLPKGSPTYLKSLDFNQTYSKLLDYIHQACNGKQAVLKDGIILMYQLKYKAIELMSIPITETETAGPSFEYVKQDFA
jgi:hypothetical protein